MTSPRFERLEYHEVTASPGFADWLADQQVGLAFTNAARLFLVGLRRDGSLSVVERGFSLCTAVEAVDEDTLYLATRYQLWRLRNAVPPGDVTEAGFDRIFVPQTGWTTGLIGIDDIAVDPAGSPVFVNRRFSCLATTSETLNFAPVWKPPFVTELRPDERCGLSGVVLRDGRPAYVTSASRSDAPRGWRDEQRSGGVVLSVPDGEVVAAGLSLPGSPVLEGSRLLLCNGGAGELSAVDLDRGSADPVVGLPGLTRGLALHGRFAVVGTSRRPWDESFGDVAIADRLDGAGPRSVCGVHVVDLETATVAHSLVLDGVGPDIGDVAVLPRTSRPDAVAYQGEEVENLVTFFLKDDTGAPGRV